MSCQAPASMLLPSSPVAARNVARNARQTVGSAMHVQRTRSQPQPALRPQPAPGHNPFAPLAGVNPDGDQNQVLTSDLELCLQINVELT